MVLLVILLVLFFCSHSILAADVVKRSAERLLGGAFRFYRIGYNLLSLLFLAAILYILLFTQEPHYIFLRGVVTSYIGCALMGIGVIIMVLAFSNYDLGEFSGIRQLSQQIHHPEQLIVTGLNRYIRNPLYTGVIVFVIGFVVWQPSQMNLLSSIIIIVYIYIGATLEERKLEAAFGDSYRMYRSKVRMLIPFVF